MSNEPERDLEGIEVRLLLEGLFLRHGYDFRDYAPASIRRRIISHARAQGYGSISELQNEVLRDSACRDRLLRALTVNTTSMFRDPGFYVAFREKVVPLLATYPFARIWHAGCSRGEEVYSLSILLTEAGIRKKCLIYATDLCDGVLAEAKDGMFPAAAMQEYAENYQKAGGSASLSDYYTATYEHAIFEPSLRDGIVFAAHNLASDHAFNEFNVILCRNVMIYFNEQLQERVHGLLYESLGARGVLALGHNESLRFTRHESSYEALDDREHLYRKLSQRPMRSEHP